MDLKVKQDTRKVGCIELLKKVLYINQSHVEETVKFLHVHLQRRKRRMYVVLVVRMAESEPIWQALALLHIRCYTFHCSFRSLNNTATKFGKILVKLMKNISNLFFALLWGLETSSRPFYDFGKMRLKWDNCSDFNFFFFLPSF